MVKVDFQKIFKPLVMFWPWHRSSSWYFCLRQCEWIKLRIIKKWDLVALVFHSENESCKASGTCLLPSKATSSSSFCCSLQTFQYLQAVTLHKYTSPWAPDGFSEFVISFQQKIFKSNLPDTNKETLEQFSKVSFSAILENFWSLFCGSVDLRGYLDDPGGHLVDRRWFSGRSLRISEQGWGLEMPLHLKV